MSANFINFYRKKTIVILKMAGSIMMMHPIFLPTTMRSLCSPPSVIVPVPTKCKKGTFCCDHKDPGIEREKPRPPPPPPRQPPPPRPPTKSGPNMSSLIKTFGPLLLTTVTGNPETASAYPAVAEAWGSPCNAPVAPTGSDHTRHA